MRISKLALAEKASIILAIVTFGIVLFIVAGLLLWFFLLSGIEST